MADVDQIGLMKTMLWEEAKGKLRALVLISGAHPSTRTRAPEWTKVEKRVEDFIKKFEDDGLQE